MASATERRGKGHDVTGYESRVGRREPGQVAAVVVAALFVVTAVLGVGPGVLDNLVHLGFGVAGLAMSRRPRDARTFLIGGGVAYVLLWQFGGVVDPGLVPFHTGNAGVHLSLVASMIGLAVLGSGRARRPLTVAPAAAFRNISTASVRRRQAPSRPAGRASRSRW